MPVVQYATGYTATMRPGLEGQVATEWGGANHVETRVAEVAINFGRGVSVGTGDKGAILGTGVVANIIGVTVRDPTLVMKAGETVDKYQVGDNVAVLNEGDIWVANTTAVVAGTVVTYDNVTAKFGPDSGTGTVIPGSRWLTSAATNGLACARFTRAYHTT